MSRLPVALIICMYVYFFICQTYVFVLLKALYVLSYSMITHLLVFFLASSCSDLRVTLSRRPGKEKEENDQEANTTIQTTKSGATDLSLSVATTTNNLRMLPLGVRAVEKAIQIRKTTKMMMRTA